MGYIITLFCDTDFAVPLLKYGLILFLGLETYQTSPTFPIRNMTVPRPFKAIRILKTITVVNVLLKSADHSTVQMYTTRTQIGPGFSWFAQHRDVYPKTPACVVCPFSLPRSSSKMSQKFAFQFYQSPPQRPFSCSRKSF